VAELRYKALRLRSGQALNTKVGLSYTYDANKIHAARQVNGSGGASKTVTIRARGDVCCSVWPEMKLYVNGVLKST
jgi:hypothetical protein